jgi:DNA-binding MarR family transcriptional regulator
VANGHVTDPTHAGRWRPLRLLLAALDDDIARLYAESDIEGVKPSFVMELIRLHHQGPMTITELAESVQRTHSAMSQKVAAMRAAGMVQTTTGADARSKEVSLTPRAAAVVDRLVAEWQATEATVAEIEAELPYPLSQVVSDIQEVLARKSFHDRIADRLADDPAWSPPLFDSAD